MDSETQEKEPMAKPELKVLQKEADEPPADQQMTVGRGALIKLIDLLDSTPNVPAARKEWLAVVRDIDQELVAGVVNARLIGNTVHKDGKAQ